MSNNKLNFLDTQVYISDKNIPEFRKYRKESASDVIINFKKSVTPRKYKISTLSGDIFRCNYTNTTPENREKVLNELTDLYIKNEYPRRLIENTIKEIKERNFTSRRDKTEFENEIRKLPDRYHTISLFYTSGRCDSIMSKLLRLLKTHTPQYHVNVAWRNIKLSKYYSCRLKLAITEFEKIG